MNNYTTKDLETGEVYDVKFETILNKNNVEIEVTTDMGFMSDLNERLLQAGLNTANDWWDKWFGQIFTQKTDGVTVATTDGDAVVDSQMYMRLDQVEFIESRLESEKNKASDGKDLQKKLREMRASA